MLIFKKPENIKVKEAIVASERVRRTQCLHANAREDGQFLNPAHRFDLMDGIKRANPTNVSRWIDSIGKPIESLAEKINFEFKLFFYHTIRCQIKFGEMCILNLKSDFKMMAYSILRKRQRENS